MAISTTVPIAQVHSLGDQSVITTSVFPFQTSSQLEHLDSLIAHEIQDDIIRLLPSVSQCSDFLTLLKYAQDLGAEDIRACKVLSPKGFMGSLRDVPDAGQLTYQYHALS